ncbi:Receptor-like protein 12 [Rhynchospora pubera]|uniref:Receptor-like protein 12 n=1 Tax=Rhynchospora pubera TaxID=906938 RepID=A0AAV8C1G4_9POAL|nr:Receptor-like protein 12 [Rhynchospora pubera]
MEHRIEMHLFLKFVLLILFLQAVSVHSCIKHEREALIEFKDGVNDPGSRLASWKGHECCEWTGIRCCNKTGHVIRFDLRNSGFPDEYFSWNNYSLMGKIKPSLLVLSELTYIDLSFNNFTENKFPKFFSSFRKLEYLNLSVTGLSGTVPGLLSNLSSLQYLDLSNNDELMADADVWWLSRLTSLRHLDMSRIDLQGSINWVQSLNKLPSLEVLLLDSNNLNHIPQSLPHVNFTSLKVLRLSNQDFNTTIPSWIFVLHDLTDLNLGESNFVGFFPAVLGNLTFLSNLVLDNNLLFGKIPSLYNLTKLTYLSMSGTFLSEKYINIIELASSISPKTWRRMEELVLSDNNFIGKLTGWIPMMSNLKYLDLSFTYLSGIIPDDIWNLTNIIELDLSFNCFTGSLNDTYLDRLTRLQKLSLGGNVMNLGNYTISIVTESNWQPSFHLQSLQLYSCQLGPKFPTWLQNQVKIGTLYLTDTEINDVLPKWLWNFTFLNDLDLSYNKINGELPRNLKNLTNIQYMYLNNNLLSGKIPSSFPDYLEEINLSDNRFEQLPKIVEAPNLGWISFSNNSMSGSIESSLCGISSLYYIDLSRNNLSGFLPNCSINYLTGINVANNNLSGTVPSTLCSSNSLYMLQLNSNNLTGEFPTNLQFCSRLEFLDIGENNFHGEVPKWVGENLPGLVLLRLRSNLFSGKIPLNITLLHKLRVLDLANNYFSGQLPMTLDKLTTMATMASSDDSGEIFEGWSLSETIKGIDIEYAYESLRLLRSIDLSNNNLEGEIPESVVSLIGLVNLNLSNNHLIGKIPTEIGRIRSLESLDLHKNNFSGTIPESLSTLNCLEVLNLSYNNLSGRIPTGNQLQTLDDPSIYIGNVHLCGPPLKKSCSSNTTSFDSPDSLKHANDKDKLWLYLFTEFGFVTGFLLLFFILVFKISWRCAYFKIVDEVLDKLYVWAVGSIL